MTLATAEYPRLTTRMTADEAKEVTEAIRANFDSLGKMLIEVQERKGFLALGYKSLEGYCLNEFGKGKSRVYQLIEEARIEEEIINELATSDSPIKSLKMPGTLLRQLRELESPRQRIEAIAYANQLAEHEGKRRATKTHLQVAVHKVNGNKSEQTRKVIEEIGFAKGVEVEILEGYSKCERGVVRKIDTKGQVHVELYSGNSMPIAWDVSNLRIVPSTERPQIPATMDSTKIGDIVRIFSKNSNAGKTGEIFARLNDKQALIQIEVSQHKTEIPYAELEKITENRIEQKVEDWENDLIWAANWNKSSWYYNAERREVKSFLCPNITFQIEENTKFANPSNWLENWRNKYSSSLADVLLTPDDIATLVMATAIKMSDTQKQEFLARINVLLTIPAALPLEPEQTAEFLVKDAASTALALESKETAEFLVENAASTASALEPEQTAEFLVEDAASTASPLEPEQTAEFLVEYEPNPNWRKDWLASNFPVRPEIGYSVTQGFLGEKIADRLDSLLDEADKLISKQNSKNTKRVELAKIDKDIKRTRQSIKELESFSNLQIGMLANHQKRDISQIGIITNLTLSTGGMPEVWVKWEEQLIEVPEKLVTIDIQDEKEKEL